ncbi:MULTISPECIES: DUF3150 domain-containing protein [Pseudomonas]|uniref:Cobalamine biosynthesis protein n=1 Tax=Pseudomonas putida TaxID=303 RepID=A0A6B7PXK1_PSEPU|nr:MULTISPECIES: DUF3150 domain-containing protein [Pseudomonas]QFX76855.1 Cobalamine biosynthesis protein [Pseudomonas putida]
MSTTNQTDDLGISILQDVVLFDYIIGGSTGEKTVDGDDFIREVGRMLPSGSFAWVNKYRSEAKREILKVGVSRKVNNRIRGYFVPTQHAQELAKVLNAIKEKYLAEKATFLKALPKLVEDWAESPANSVATQGGKSRADLIRQHAPQVSVLERLLTFDTSAIRISNTSYFGEGDALQKEVKGLVGQAALEIAEDVNRSWTRKGNGKTTSRILGLIRRVQDKAEAMSVLSSKFSNLEKMCASVLSAVPTGPSIEGVAYIQVSSLLSFCMDPEKILGEHATEFDPLTVETADLAPPHSETNVFFSTSTSEGTPSEADQNEVTIVPEVSVVPPLPAARKTEENRFFETAPEKPMVEPEKAEPSETTSQPPAATFIF